MISLEKMTKRLAEDHVRAREIAEGVRQVKGLVLDAHSPSTNMVYLNLSEDVSSNAQQIAEKLKALGILVDPENARRFRLVTHYWIDDAAVDKTVTSFRKALN